MTGADEISHPLFSDLLLLLLLLLLENPLAKSCKSIYYVSAVNCGLKGFNHIFFGLFKYIQNSYFDTNISNFLQIGFSRISVLHIYSPSFQFSKEPIWKMISFYFYDFVVKISKSEKLLKQRIILSQYTIYTNDSF